MFQYSHPDGTPLPDKYNSKVYYNLWEKLITSITWEDDAPQFDDFDQYTEELYKYLLENNRPCILSRAFLGSFVETFKTFYSDATKKHGTDLQRSLILNQWKNPVNFAQATYDVHTTPAKGKNGPTQVISQYTVFSGWTCDITVSFCESVFPTETICNIINTSGEFIGIGTRRHDGYGRYHIGEKVTINK